MTGAAAKALRPADDRNIRRLLHQLATLLKAPQLVDIPVVLNPRLSRTLGRLVGRPWRIELGRRALVSPKRLREVMTHEGAHAVVTMKSGPGHPAPHGPEWRRLMAIAGYPQAGGAHWRCRPARKSRHPERPLEPKTSPAVVYDHWCPVCQSSRLGRRPVKAWRCTACVAAGLHGSLEITRRRRRPTAAR
jgi:predicted SprT family Zn-dependent metalloprotease